MSGHSKWSTIKHKKGAADAKRGKIFSKLAKELTISAKANGGDPGSNITLRTILSKCKAVNMPADNIDRAIKKGTGALQSAAIEEILFESYAPGGVGMIIQCLSDNRNRSVAEVRHLLQRHNATLDVRSTVGSGSTFSVTFPAQRLRTPLLPAPAAV